MKGSPKAPRLKAALFWLLISSLFSPNLYGQQRVRVGAEILLEKHLHLLQGKRVGIVCNHTSILPNKTRLIDTLLSRGVNITALFSPEHGIGGNAPYGAKVEETVDEKSGLPVFSLYRQTASAGSMVDNVDVLLFDLQDVGARFYTYYITMARAMETAFANGKTFIILDRPNPINGVDIEGPVLDSSLQSGVGRFPLPVRHGLTLGEMARMIAGEKWASSDSASSLTVVPMDGWKREMFYDETGLPWVAPSPNMKFLSTAVTYPGTCFFEGTNLSEGRGSFKPFEYVGAPWLDGKRLARNLNALQTPGIKFHAIKFTPLRDSIRAPNPKYNGEACNGVFLQVRNRKTFRPVFTALQMISAIRSLHPSIFAFLPRSFDQLVGSSSIRLGLEKNESPDSLLAEKRADLDTFRVLSRKYLLY